MSSPELTTGDVAADAEAYCSQCGKSFPAGTARCPDDNAPLVQLAADTDSLIGRVLDGRFEISGTLGRGGMGAVYRGRQLSVDREVAIKVIHPRLASDRAVVKRFLREARLASRLNHPAIVNVIDFGQSDGVLYLVTELLRGHTLESELAGGHAMPVRRAMAIAIQLCDALGAAHASDIVHRDLKPGNVMILDDPPGRDHVKVLDFGLAKSFSGEDHTGSQVTNLGVVNGTPAYMAPEQIAGEATDPRTDLYALGCMLYEMVTGAPPFVEPAMSAILARHVADIPEPLPRALPAPFRTLVARLLAKAPGERPQTAAAVRSALEHVLGTPPSGVPITPSALDIASQKHAATALSTLTTAARPQPRRGWWIAAGAIAVVLVAVGMWRMLGAGAGDERAEPASTPVSRAPSTAQAPVSVPASVPVPDVAVAKDAAPSPPAVTAGSGSAAATPSRPATVTVKHVPASPPRPAAKPAVAVPQPPRPAAGSANMPADLDFYHGH